MLPDTALADLGGGERQLADVPAAQMAEPHGFLGGERAVADGGAQAVPGVLAGEDGCGLRAVGLDLVCHVGVLPVADQTN